MNAKAILTNNYERARDGYQRRVLERLEGKSIRGPMTPFGVFMNRIDDHQIESVLDVRFTEDFDRDPMVQDQSGRWWRPRWENVEVIETPQEDESTSEPRTPPLRLGQKVRVKRWNQGVGETFSIGVIHKIQDQKSLNGPPVRRIDVEFDDGSIYPYLVYEVEPLEIE